MSKNREIEIPPYTVFKAEIDGEEHAFIGVPREGCDICAFDGHGLCRRLICESTKRTDLEAVQFLEIKIPSPEIVLHYSEGERTAENKGEGGEE